MASILLQSVAAGVVATAAMDVWAVILNQAAGVPKPNWGLVGRWFGHLPRGRFVHEDIAKAEPIASEKALGWVMHYAIGIAYGLALVVLAGAAWRAAPTPLAALLVGWVTVGAGWFILQPGMGAGIAASRRPNARTIRLLNVAAHTVFGMGLWLGAWATAG
jgi:hypothetical protein